MDTMPLMRSSSMRLMRDRSTSVLLGVRPVGTCIEFVISAHSKVLVREAFATSVLLGVRPVGTYIEYVISAHSKVLVRDAFATWLGQWQMV